jgi:hypothetical protein
VRFDQRAEVQILDRALGLAVAAEIHAIGHRLVLQVALAALVADRAIERVVDEQELHHPLARLLDHGRVGLDHRRLAFRAGAQVAHLHRAGGGGFRRAAHHLDKAHPAIAGDGQPLVVAEARDLDPRLLAGLDQGHRPVDLDFLPSMMILRRSRSFRSTFWASASGRMWGADASSFNNRRSHDAGQAGSRARPLTKCNEAEGTYVLNRPKDVKYHAKATRKSIDKTA